MPHLPIKLFAVALVFGLAFGLGQAEAAPLPALNAASGLVAADAATALPVEQAHYRGYRGWGWGYPRYNSWNNYYYRPYYRPYSYGYGYRPYGYGYWNRPYYRRYW